jgi:hypothetical protein
VKFCIGALLLALLVPLARSGKRIHAQEERTVTVPCKQEKCKTLDLWNEARGKEIKRADRVEALFESLVHDPPGLVRSLDREKLLAELVEETEALRKVYEEMARLERK